MNNDLISRSTVIKLIESKCTDGCFGNEDITLIDAYVLLDDVSELPTAYDVDKVVERLEENRDDCYSRMKKLENCNDFLSRHIFDAYHHEGIAYDRAIEIVKAGGTNDT